MKLAVGELLKATGGQLISGFPDTVCERVSIDTRTLKAGDVFFALEGPRFDGHTFLRMASQKRARAIVLHRLDPDLRLEGEAPPDLVQVSDTLKALQDTARACRAQAKKT